MAKLFWNVANARAAHAGFKLFSQLKRWSKNTGMLCENTIYFYCFKNSTRSSWTICSRKSWLLHKFRRRHSSYVDCEMWMYFHLDFSPVSDSLVRVRITIIFVHLLVECRNPMRLSQNKIRGFCVIRSFSLANTSRQLSTHELKKQRMTPWMWHVSISINLNFSLVLDSPSIYLECEDVSVLGPIWEPFIRQTKLCIYFTSGKIRHPIRH